MPKNFIESGDGKDRLERLERTRKGEIGRTEESHAGVLTGSGLGETDFEGVAARDTDTDRGRRSAQLMMNEGPGEDSGSPGEGLVPQPASVGSNADVSGRNHSC